MATARITLTGRQFRPDDLSAGQLPPASGQPSSSGTSSRTEIRTHPAERETVTVNRERACGTALAPVPP